MQQIHPSIYLLIVKLRIQQEEQSVLCPNNCGGLQNGYCFNGQCQCQVPLIGSDCSIRATLLGLNTDAEFSLENTTIYYFYTEHSNDSTVTPLINISLQTQTEIVINSNYGDTQNSSNQTLIETGGQELILNAKLYQNNSIIQNKYEVNQTNNSIVTIKIYPQNQNQSNSQNNNLYNIIAIALSIGLVLIIVIIIFVIRRIKMNGDDKKENQQVTNVAEKVIQVEVDVSQKLNKTHQIESDTQCTICLIQYENTQILSRTPCKHIFHQECLNQWLKKKLQCPICRSEILIKTIIQLVSKEVQKVQQTQF